MRSVIMALACMVALSTPAYAHCDALDGPVVLAAREALRTGDFALIVVWVKRPQEHALRSAFRQTLTVLERSGELKNIQPSEQDVETALMAIVGTKNR